MMIKRKALAKAITLAISSTALYMIVPSSASASTTMYNTYTTANQTATDGWVYGFCTTCSNSTRAIAYNAANPQAYTAGGPAGGGFYGTDASNPTAYTSVLPFNYGGTSHLNWGVHLTSVGDSAEISKADSLARYGYAAEIDTGGGAWRDDGSSNSLGIQTGWKHQTDVGLIKSDQTQQVTINLTNLSQDPNINNPRFGVTVFEGMDAKTGAYVHHGSWNNPTAIPAANGGLPPAQAAHPYNMDNPWGTVGLKNIGYSDLVNNAANPFTFTAEAGKVYSIYLGGVDFGDWNDKLADYKMNISTSPVPLPGAVWLFGSAAAGMGVIRKRKTNNKV